MKSYITGLCQNRAYSNFTFEAKKGLTLALPKTLQLNNCFNPNFVILYMYGDILLLF